MAFEPDYTDEDEDNPYPQGSTCKHCGAGDLAWVHTGVRWRLVEDGGLFHVCKGSPDDFDVIE